MNHAEFIQSPWYRKGQTAVGRAVVRRSFGKWSRLVANANLLKRAGELWRFFKSPAMSRTDKALVTAALLYLISPFDVVPDVLPVAGWIDDLAIAAMALGYINKKLNQARSGGWISQPGKQP